MKRKKLRLLFKLLKIIQTGPDYCAEDLAEELNINKRTLCRYISDLQASGVPINYDRKQKCYTIDKEFFLQYLNLDLHDFMGLLLLKHNLKDQANTYFNNFVLKALIKTETLLPDELRCQCHEALEKVSTCPAHQAVVNYSDEMNIHSSKMSSQYKRRRQIISIKSTFENKETVSLKQVYLAAEKEEKVSKSAVFCSNDIGVSLRK